MMMMDERAEEEFVEEVQPRTWYEFFVQSGQASYSFFAEGVSGVSRALAQAERLPPELQLLPDAGVENVEMYRVHGVVLSTGNIWQLALLRAVFPQINFNSIYEQRQIDDFRTEHNRLFTSNAWRSIQTYTNDDTDAMYGRRFRAFMQSILAAQGDSNNFNDRNDSDDLPTKIAKAIAQHYYINLELTVTDIQQAIAAQYGEPWNEGEFSLDDIDADFVSRIVHASIDNGRMELRTLLPYEQIVQVAVNELRHPPLSLQSVLAWMAAVWNKFVELLTDGWGYVFSLSNP